MSENLAPASGGLFGSSTAPAPAAGGGFFNTAAAQQQPMTSQQPAVQLSASTPYSQLPDNAKRAIDSIYQLMMQHRRTLATVKTMAPSLLVVEGTTNNLHSTNGRTSPSSPADAAAGFRRRNVVTDPSSKPLPQQMVTLQTQINTLLRSAESNLTEAQHLKARAGETACQAKMHGAWPIENVAARSGVALSSIKRLLGDMNSRSEAASGGGGVGSNIPASSLNISGMNNLDALALQHIMDMRAATVDRIETMPSPYLLEVLRSFEQRLEMIYRDVEAVQARLRIAEEAERVQSMGGVGMLGDETSLLLSGGDNYAAMTSLMLYEGAGGGPAHLSKRLATLARSQNDLFLRIASQAARAHDGLEEVKLRYRRFCETMQGGYFEDPFLKADAEEVSRERELQQKIVERQLAAPSTAVGGTSLAAAVPTAPGAAPPSAMGGLFGSTPAPSSGGLFGNNSAPAPSTGGLFGAPGK